MTEAELRTIWEDVLMRIAPELPRAHFITWFEKTYPLACRDSVFVVGVPNGFHQSWLNNKYLPLIFKALKSVYNDVNKVVIEVDTRLNNLGAEDFIDIQKILGLPKNVSRKKAVMERGVGNGKGEANGLNPRYTFNNFVVGDENRLAYAAAKAVADKPGTMYNPLFIYGGVGLGKTHLLQGIGNSVAKKFGKNNVLYITSEQFTNELVEAIRDRKGKKFKEKYRRVDVLIIDDIQFLSNKVQTQIEFFHTFNDLYHVNKQIVLSSDRPPREISALEERLRSRFEAGMLADIQPPDFETKVAILRTKCQEKGHLISNEVLEFVAEFSGDNIRELEGVLTQIIADIELTNQAPSIETAKKIIARLFPDVSFSGEKPTEPETKTGYGVPTYVDIINVAAEAFGVKPGDITGNSRKQEVAGARQMCMYVIRKELNKSYEAIGEMFGGKNHTTVMHACKKTENEINNNKNVLKVYNSLKRDLFR